MQYSSADLLKMIKTAAIDIVNANKPVEVSYAVVETDVPLGLRVDPKTLLTEIDLIFTRNVTDYDLQLTESGLGTRIFHVKNALRIGEKVILIRFQGGQHYLVLDRVV